MPNKTILVTGGLGYIGSHTTVALLEKGYEVIVIDDLSNAKAETQQQIEEITQKKFKFFEFDLKDQEALDEFFSHHEIDGIIHFAAHKQVNESARKPLKYYRNNLISLINILEAAKENNVPPIIYSSSCTVYGENKKQPLKEDFKKGKCTNPYGKTKQMGEEILADFCHATRINIISLRYFNPIGAHASSKIGELSGEKPVNLLPYLTKTAAKEQDYLPVFGKDYPTKDGTPVRDYIYVGDLADAHLKALERLLKKENKKPFEVFNIGTGKGFSVLEVINAFEEATGIKINYKIEPPREGDLAIAYADTEKSEKVLGWRAKTTLKEALQTAWNWQQSLKDNQ